MNNDNENDNENENDDDNDDVDENENGVCLRRGETFFYHTHSHHIVFYFI